MPLWNDAHTATKYDAYTQNFPMYRETSRDLVRVADIASFMRVLDLACGTGVTSRAVLEVLGETGHVEAVDEAAAMLEVAQSTIHAENITFHLAAADQIHRLGIESVDRIVCNSAFWQLPPDETLQSVQSVLRADGLLTFNIPVFTPPRQPDGQELPNLRFLMRQIAVEEFGIDSLPDLPKHRAQNFDEDSVQSLFDRNGFKLIGCERIDYRQSLAAAKSFFEIPIMTETVLPDMDYAVRMNILDRAFERLKLDPATEYSSSWEYFVGAIA